MISLEGIKNAKFQLEDIKMLNLNWNLQLKRQLMVELAQDAKLKDIVLTSAC